MDRRQVWDHRGGLTAAGLLALASGTGFVVVYVLTVRTTPGRELGDASLRGALLSRAGAARAVDAVLGIVSSATLLAGLATVALIALVRLRRMPGLAAAGLLVAANGSTWLLKTQLLTRPDLGLSEITPATHNSLPSGHTTAVFSVVVALMIVAGPRLRHPVAVVGGLFAVLTALATMSAGWHRAGDSIAAFLNVGFWAGVAALVVVLAGASGQPSQQGAPGKLRWGGALSTAAAASTGLALLVVLALAIVEPLRASSAGAALAFFAGGVLVVVSAAAVLAAELFVLDRTDPAP